MAFPSHDLGWLAWLGLVPLLIGFTGKRPTYCLFTSIVCGIVFFSGVFNWILEVPGYKIHHHAILIPYLSLYFGLFGWVFGIIAKRWGNTYAHLVAPFIWVFTEYIRSHFFFLALPWGLLAHSQYQYTSIIQIASIFGVYGISFLIVLVNSVLAVLIAPLIYSLRETRSQLNQLPSKQIKIALTCITASLVVINFIYGHMRIFNIVPGQAIKVTIIQGNIDQGKKKEPKRHAKFIMQRHIELTKEAAGDHPTLVVWPEAATPGLILLQRKLMNQIRSTIKAIGAYFLIGSSEYPKFAKVKSKSKRSGNTALFFSPKDKAIGQYLKIRLVPFGEYIPYEGIISWPDFVIPKEKENWNIPGKEFTLFDINQTKFGVLICWEIVFPELFRQFVKNGANFMLNITNEGWFGDTAAPHQMLAISVFRAVENRISLVRAANTGVSCFIDPLGRITGRVQNAGKDTFVKGFLTRKVQLSKQRTYYTMHGDVFAYICIMVSFIGIIAALIRRKADRINGIQNNSNNFKV